MTDPSAADGDIPAAPQWPKATDPVQDPTGSAEAEPGSVDAELNAMLDDAAAQAPSASVDPANIDVETLVTDLEAVTAERDSHLADLQRLTADFANFRKQASRRQSDTIVTAAAGVVEKLLPILDACEAAVQQGSADVEPILSALYDTLGKEGLARIEGVDDPFDPEQHEAVMHEPGDGESVVAEVLRTGYSWNGRIVRPAMVKVRG